MRVKICGITNLEDALFAVSAGADALGFVFAPSKRQISQEMAQSIIKELPPWIGTVGVFVDEKEETICQLKEACHFQSVQLHGSLSPSKAKTFFPSVIQVISSPAEIDDNFPCNAFLLDLPKDENETKGPLFEMVGSIRTKKPLILAGGLNPENVERATMLKLYGVDVPSGVEEKPGKKDPEKVRRFIAKAKGLSC